MKNLFYELIVNKPENSIDYIIIRLQRKSTKKYLSLALLGMIISLREKLIKSGKENITYIVEEISRNKIQGIFYNFLQFAQ